MDRVSMIDPAAALPGRDAQAFDVPRTHAVLGTPLEGPWEDGPCVLYVAMGCFWGVEKLMWELPAVAATAAGYMGGFTPNPTYQEVCTGRTGHAETVMVAYDPDELSDLALLQVFWEQHDPTQGYRQGGDLGTQYRSALYYTSPSQQAAIAASEALFAPRLQAAGFGQITTEIRPATDAGPFYYAEDYHQQYLAKNPQGYCPIHATGIACPMPERTERG